VSDDEKDLGAFCASPFYSSFLVQVVDCRSHFLLTHPYSIATTSVFVSDVIDAFKTLGTDLPLLFHNPKVLQFILSSFPPSQSCILPPWAPGFITPYLDTILRYRANSPFLFSRSNRFPDSLEFTVFQSCIISLSFSPWVWSPLSTKISFLPIMPTGMPGRKPSYSFCCFNLLPLIEDAPPPGFRFQLFCSPSFLSCNWFFIRTVCGEALSPPSSAVDAKKKVPRPFLLPSLRT